MRLRGSDRHNTHGRGHVCPLFLSNVGVRDRNEVHEVIKSWHAGGHHSYLVQGVESPQCRHCHVWHFHRLQLAAVRHPLPQGEFCRTFIWMLNVYAFPYPPLPRTQVLSRSSVLEAGSEAVRHGAAVSSLSHHVRAWRRPQLCAGRRCKGRPYRCAQQFWTSNTRSLSSNLDILPWQAGAVGGYLCCMSSSLRMQAEPVL